MPLKTYIDVLRLDGANHYYLWQSDLEAGSFDTPIVRVGERPVTFREEASARGYAATLGLPVDSKPPFLHDLDALSAWCASPRLEGADFRTLGVAAGLLDGLGVLGFDAVALPDEPEGQAADLWDKLMCGLAKANETEPSDWIPPAWEEGDPEALGVLLLPAINRVRELLSPQLREETN